MPRIRTVDPEEATGLLQRLYDRALRRAGRVFNVVSIQSLCPPIMDASLKLYERSMLAPGGLPRATREMLATVVAREMDCFY